MRILMLVAALLIGAPDVSAQTLPKEVQVDLLITKLKRSLKDSSMAAQIEALKHIDKIKELVADPPTSLSYYEARSALATGDVLRAHRAAAEYVNRTGRKGKF